MYSANFGCLVIKRHNIRGIEKYFDIFKLQNTTRMPNLVVLAEICIAGC